MKRLFASARGWAGTIGFAVFAAVLLPETRVRACINDSDSLRAEVEGIPEVVQIITGRFERNPPLYYEMRLTRQSAAIEANPGDYAAYDDCGACCDRLGRGPEALAWMARKRARLEADGNFADPLAPETDSDFNEHVYRYYANVGTFRVHHWFREGREPERLDEVRQARDEIARAIEIKPDAHFGREKYQLAAMEWVLAVLEVPQTGVGEAETFLDSFLFAGDFPPTLPDDAVEGLAGLVALGNAWESVDVFFALAYAFDAREDGVAGGLAYRRVIELVKGGGESIDPHAPKGEALIGEARHYLARSLDSDNMLRTIGNYEEMRREAEDWHARRTNYMLARLAAGRHPDTDSDFWREFDSGTPVPPWEHSASSRFARATKTYIDEHAQIGLAIALVLVGLLVAYNVRYHLRKARSSGEGPPTPE